MCANVVPALLRCARTRSGTSLTVDRVTRARIPARLARERVLKISQLAVTDAFLTGRQRLAQRPGGSLAMSCAESHGIPS